MVSQVASWYGRPCQTTRCWRLASGIPSSVSLRSPITLRAVFHSVGTQSFPSACSSIDDNGWAETPCAGPPAAQYFWAIFFMWMSASRKSRGAHCTAR